MALTKITGNVIETGAVTSASINTASIATAIANDGLVANSSGIFVNANNGLLANSSGTFVNASDGLHANSTGVRILANNGLSANSSGTFVVGGTGVTSNATGIHIGQDVSTTSDVTFANVTQTASIIGTHAITANTTHLLVGSTKIDAVDTAIANLVASAPGTLDTLNEIATALGSDPDLANTLTTSIATKMPIAGGTFTGAVTGTSFTAPSGFLGGVEGGIRIHSTGTKFFNIYANNTARDATMDIGASDARFKDLHISANAYIGGGIIDYGSSSTLKLQANNTLVAEIEPRNIKLSSYATFGRVKSGADTLLGHNVYADGANNSTILQTNSSYYGAWIRMYYDEGISFGTVTSPGTADDTVWTRADESNEKMRLTNDGKLGIGILDPVYKLDVVGNIRATSAGSGSYPFLATYDSTYSNNNLAGIYQDGAESIFRLYNSAGATEVQFATGTNSYILNEKVGIGTSAPNSTLDLTKASDTAERAIRIENSSARLYVGVEGSSGNRFGGSAVDNAFIGTTTADGLEFGTSNSVRAIITSAGNFGIGNTSPQGRLTISGPNTGSQPVVDITATGTGTFQRGVRMLNSGMASGDHIMYALGRSDNNSNMGQTYFYFDGAGSSLNRISMGLHSVDDVFNITANGNIGIANTNPQSLLHLHGETNSWTTSPTILFTSTGTATNVRNWRIGPADTNYGNFHIAKSASQGGTPATTAEGSVFTIDYQGNVGIGTVSPDKKLTISANTNPAIKLNDEDSSKYYYKQLESDGVVRTYMNTVLIKEEFPNGEVVRRSAENFNLGGWDWRNSVLLGGSGMDGYSYPTSNYSPSDPIGPYVNGYKTWYPNVNIRFNQNAVYTCSLTVFQVNDGGGVGYFYGGFICKDKDFNTLQVDAIGTYQYIMGSSQVHTTGNRYTYTVTIQGTAGSGVSNYTKLDAGTVWISPMMLINYSTSNGQQTVIENFTVSARGV